MKRILFLILAIALAASGCSKTSETAAPTGTVTKNPNKPGTPVGTNIGSTEDEEDQNDDSGEDLGDGEDINVGDGSGTNNDNTDDTGTTEDGDDIEFTNIGPNDPCYDYMNSKFSVPVANCVKIENGRLDNNYPKTVKFARACLLKSSHDNNITLFTVTGTFIEVDNDWNRIVHRLNGFKDVSIKDDRVKFSYKDNDFKTTIDYDIVKETLRVKQVTKTFKRKVRYFQLGCTPVHSIR